MKPAKKRRLLGVYERAAWDVQRDLTIYDMIRIQKPVAELLIDLVEEVEKLNDPKLKASKG